MRYTRAAHRAADALLRRLSAEGRRIIPFFFQKGGLHNSLLLACLHDDSTKKLASLFFPSVMAMCALIT